MRHLLLLVFLCTNFMVKAQSSLEALFQQGSELEYQMFGPKASLGKPKLVELSRLTLTVTHVKDSNGVTYSHITKNVRSASNPDFGFQQNFVVTRTKGFASLPQNLMNIDTVYSADMGVKGKKGGRPYATATIKGNPIMKFSVDMEKSFEQSIKTFSIEGTVMGMEMNRSSALYGIPTAQKWSMECTIDRIEVGPKTSISTQAGTFECFKVTTYMHVKAMGQRRSMETQSAAYISTEYGFLKTDASEGQPTGSFELVRIKKG